MQVKTAIIILSFYLLQAVYSRPIVDDLPIHSHARHRRAAAHLGDLSATEAGILNEQYVPLCDCKEILDSGLNKSGLYKIDPDGSGDFTVFCDMTLLGGGWTVLQRRINDLLTFERKWKSYRNGFGDLDANFWLGLNKIKRITDMGTYNLYVGLEDHYSPSGTAWAKYSSFSLGSEASNYKLTISGFDSTSTAGDSLVTHNEEAFSTLDDDNDSHDTEHCSQTYKGGWWYKDCHDSNLNGVWYANGQLADPNTADGIIWEHWRGGQYSLKTSVIAVRPA